MKKFSNRAIADMMREMAAFYEMEGVMFKPQAYERAADAIAASDLSAVSLFKTEGVKGLRRIPGVGEGIAGHIKGLLTKGSFPEYVRFKKRYPMDVLAITSIEGVGPKTALAMYKALKVKTLKDLERAAAAGKIAGVPHYGVKAEEHIMRSLGIGKAKDGTKTRGPALVKKEVGERKILGYILPLAERMEKELRVVPDDSFGAAIQYFTGDKEHNIVVRKMAIKKGLMLNEYGIWRGKKLIASRTEEDVYEKLGLPYMDPEIRTNSGEIEAAKDGTLPKLIAYGEVRGDLQTQTDWTDGTASIEVMAAAAKRLGREYMAVTDHTKALAMTSGLDEKRLAKQGKEIDALNEKLSGFTVLKGSEVDILKDGSLDLKDAALAKLDFVGASVHSHFRLPRSQQTARVIEAMKNPNVDAIFHPTGRKINKRDPIDVDMAALLKAAKATGTAMEIDAYPDRSDLKDVHVRMAVVLGVKLVIDTDAHATRHLGYMDLGTAIARRGWAEKKDVLNARPLKELMKWLKTPKKDRR